MLITVTRSCTNNYCRDRLVSFVCNSRGINTTSRCVIMMRKNNEWRRNVKPLTMFNILARDTSNALVKVLLFTGFRIASIIVIFSFSLYTNIVYCIQICVRVYYSIILEVHEFQSFVSGIDR